MLYTKSILYSCKGGRADEHWAKYAAAAGKAGGHRPCTGGAVLRGPGAARTRPPRHCWKNAAVPLLAAATPRAVWLEADPDSLTAAGILAGEDVAKHLEGCTAALLLAVTLGPGVDVQIRRPV